MSIPPGGFDPYNYNSEGSSFNNPAGQGNGGDNPLFHQVYEFNGRNGGDQGSWRNMGPMQMTSSDGQQVFNIQNAYFDFGRAFGDGQGDYPPQRYGGYDQFANPQYDGQMMDPRVRALAARELQNYFLGQQEQQMANAEMWQQQYPPQNYFRRSDCFGGAQPYFHERYRGPEISISSNPFYSGYYPGYSQPGFSIGIGGHGARFRLTVA